MCLSVGVWQGRKEGGACACMYSCMHACVRTCVCDDDDDGELVL